MSLESQLERIDKERKKIETKIEKRNSNKTIKCSCEEMHKIKDLDLIQTYWYEEPYSCNAGDHWIAGELQFVCPKTGMRNRLLFNNYDVSYENRDKYEFDPASQFSRNYKRLFKSVTDDKSRKDTPFRNNYYVDQHRKKFGLVEKTVTP